jgi:hypothetical protein
MFLIEMIFGWLWNCVIWIALTILGCWLFGRILKIVQAGHYPSTSPMWALGIIGYFVGSIGGFIKGWITMPWSIKAATNEQLYFQHLYRLTLNWAHTLALIGIIVGLIIVLKEGRKTKLH